MKAVVRAVAPPDPTPLLFCIAIISALLWSEDTGWASFLPILAVLVPSIVYFLTINLDFAAVVLIGSVAGSRYFVPISGLKARPEHIAIGLLLLALPFWMKAGVRVRTWIAADYLLVLYIGMNFCSSLFTSPSPSQTSRWAAQQTAVILPYFVVRFIASTPERFRRVFGVFLCIGVAEAAYAILAFFSNLAFGTSYGIELGQYGIIPGTYGTLYEANLLGSYSGACFIVLLVLYFTNPRKKYLSGICITFSAAAISLSRGAVLATALATLLAVGYAWRTKIIQHKALRNVGLTILGVTLVLTPALVSMYSERLSTVDVTDITADDTITGRVVTSAIALEDIVSHPFFGTGTSSFQLTFDYSQVDPNVEAGWIGNTELRVLHDTGLVGLALLASFLLLLLLPARKLLKQELHPRLLGLLLAGFVYCISFQATEGTLLGFPWIHLGLIGCAISIYGEQDTATPLPKHTGLR